LILTPIRILSVEVDKSGRTIKLTAKPTGCIHLTSRDLIGLRDTLNVTATAVIDVRGPRKRHIIHCLVTVVINTVTDLIFRQPWHRTADFTQTIRTAAQSRCVSTRTDTNRTLRANLVTFVYTIDTVIVAPVTTLKGTWKDPSIRIVAVTIKCREPVAIKVTSCFWAIRPRTILVDTISTNLRSPWSNLCIAIVAIQATWVTIAIRIDNDNLFNHDNSNLEEIRRCAVLVEGSNIHVCDTWAIRSEITNGFAGLICLSLILEN
jgi:hypothetical protein